jgi:hypothetical protein
MTVLISDLLRADSIDQPVTTYDAPSGTYQEWDMLIEHNGRLVLIRRAELYDPALYIEWVRHQLGDDAV